MATAETSNEKNIHDKLAEYHSLLKTIESKAVNLSQYLEQLKKKGMQFVPSSKESPKDPTVPEPVFQSQKKTKEQPQEKKGKSTERDPETETISLDLLKTENSVLQILSDNFVVDKEGQTIMDHIFGQSFPSC